MITLDKFPSNESVFLSFSKFELITQSLPT